MDERYLRQAELVIRVLSHVATEDVFALKGGTAINLFELDMPRLSVDIDLCYTCIDDRASAVRNINAALSRLSTRLSHHGIENRLTGAEAARKIVCAVDGAAIKIEPNYILRGTVFPTRKMSDAASVQRRFGFAKVNVLSKAELYGGKFCAALDRQHPRDLFDVMMFYRDNDLTEDIKMGFLAYALSHNRPLHELLNPILQDHEEVFRQQFVGMTDCEFTYEMHRSTFEKLRDDVLRHLSESDRANLLDFVSLKGDLASLAIPHLGELPSISWKQKNLATLRDNNPKKFLEQHDKLEKLFSLSKAQN